METPRAIDRALERVATLADRCRRALALSRGEIAPEAAGQDACDLARADSALPGQRGWLPPLVVESIVRDTMRRMVLGEDSTPEASVFRASCPHCGTRIVGGSCDDLCAAWVRTSEPATEWED